MYRAALAAAAMGDALPSSVGWVQVMQAMVARELVDGFGLPERQVAAFLGIVPSAVSQYVSGKRMSGRLGRYVDDERARRIARRTAQQLMTGAGDARAVLEASIALSDLFARRRTRSRAEPGEPAPKVRREVPRWLRNRIAGEQTAVAECMRLAQRSRDELTRALFRQIASDSLRHAEIVASLAAYLDRGISSSVPTGITRADVEQLIVREHEAEETSEEDLGPSLGGVMRILWESMESDEKKHERLLQQLLVASGTGGAAAGRRRRSLGPAGSATAAR